MTEEEQADIDTRVKQLETTADRVRVVLMVSVPLLGVIALLVGLRVQDIRTLSEEAQTKIDGYNTRIQAFNDRLEKLKSGVLAVEQKLKQAQENLDGAAKDAVDEYLSNDQLTSEVARLAIAVSLHDDALSGKTQIDKLVIGDPDTPFRVEINGEIFLFKDGRQTHEIGEINVNEASDENFGPGDPGYDLLDDTGENQNIARLVGPQHKHRIVGGEMK